MERYRGKRALVDELILDDSLVPRITLVLVLFTLVTFVSSVYWEHVGAGPIGDIVEQALEHVEEAESVAETNYFLLGLLIFVNNVIVAVRDIILSFTIVLPFLDVSFNAIVVGYLIGMVVSASPIIEGAGNAIVILAALLPHGSVEIPAIAVAASTSFYVVDRIRGRSRNLLQVVRRNLLLTIYMLAVAAIIEIIVTPVVAVIVALAASVI